MSRRIIRFSLLSFTTLVCGTAYMARPTATKRETIEFQKTGLYAQESFLLSLSRIAAISSVTALSRFFIECLNSFKIEQDEHFERFLSLAKQGKSRKRGLITVANHTSVFDDPVLQSSIIGFVSPEVERWGICKESICFSNDFKAAFTGAGKVFPIHVGSGVEQPAFKAVGRKLVEGDWIHVYPEAACIQSGFIGRGQHFGCRKEEKAKEIGLLKWGVGKLIARTAFDGNPPIVIPYYHTGMDKVKPQLNLPESNSLSDPWYILGRTGNKINVYFGPPIDFTDIFEEYEQKLKQKRRIAFISLETNEFVNWDGSTQDEFLLYSKLTKRVENALLALEKKVKEKQSK